MTTPHDELFCRLAIRKGLFDRNVGVEIIQRFRSERKQKVGIAKFAVEEGYVGADAADEIEEAISRRASGHVTEVPHHRAAPAHPGMPERHGHAHAHSHPHHHHHGGRGSKGPVQIAVVIVAALTVLGCVLFVVLKMNEKPAQPARPRGAPDLAGSAPTQKVREFKTPELLRQEAQNRPVSTEEMNRLNAQATDAINTAKRTQMDEGCFRALEVIAMRKKSMGGDMLPEVILARFAEAEKELQGFLEDQYKELLSELRRAQDKNDATATQQALAEMELKCGPERVASAKKELKLQ